MQTLQTLSSGQPRWPLCSESSLPHAELESVPWSLTCWGVGAVVGTNSWQLIFLLGFTLECAWHLLGKKNQGLQTQMPNGAKQSQTLLSSS